MKSRNLMLAALIGLSFSATAAFAQQAPTPSNSPMNPKQLQVTGKVARHMPTVLMMSVTGCVISNVCTDHELTVQKHSGRCNMQNLGHGKVYRVMFLSDNACHQTGITYGDKVRATGYLSSGNGGDTFMSFTPPTPHDRAGSISLLERHR